MADDFSTQSSGLSSPAYKAAAVALSTAHTTLSYVPRAVYVGAGGNIVCIPAGSTDTVTFVAVPTGTLLPMRVSVILGTTYGTNAASMVAMW